jgi:charged multivesicular body protein 7
LTPVDLNILLVYLARDKQEISFDSKTIKFKSANETIPSPITQQDATIANLRDLISSLNTQLPPLTVRIATLDANARVAVASKSATAARSALRSKKLAEATLARRTDTLAQLEEVFSKIEAAADQVEIVRVMEASAAVLRGLHKEVGGVEGVEGVVDALKEEMGRVDEVSGIINEVGQEGAVIDEAEVDEEFEALEQVEREKKEKTEKEEEEAEKTSIRLAELEKFEKQEKEREQREREEQRELERLEKQAGEEPAVEETSQSLSSMSFKNSENFVPTNSEQQQERVEKSPELLPAP